MSSASSFHFSPEALTQIDPELKQQLRSAILSLSYHAFEHLVRQLLEKLGYSDARLLTRRFRRGRNRHGGRDLEAVARTGLTRVPVIIQAKQYERPVSRRFIDELRGAMLRLDAQHGILISTSTFSRPALQAAMKSPLAPVHVLDGEMLLTLLCIHRLGVRESKRGKLLLDRSYFGLLQIRFPSENTGQRPDAPREQGIASEILPPESHPRDPVDSSVNQGGGMLWRTHCLLAINTLWLLALVPGILTAQQTAPLAVIAATAALLPDLDADESRLSTIQIAGIRPLAPIARIIHNAWGHRGPLHSLLAVLAVAVLGALLSPLWGWNVSLALLLGYGSHIAGDAMTRTGVPLLYPSRKRYFLLPRALRIVTGSWEEELLLALFAAGALFLLLSALPPLIQQGENPLPVPGAQLASKPTNLITSDALPRHLRRSSLALSGLE